MSTRKNYDRYNMTISSLKEDGEEEKVSAAARIFERRRQAINQEGDVSEDTGMSPVEIFRRRRERLGAATQKIPKQMDGERSDKEHMQHSTSTMQSKTPILSSYLSGNHESRGTSYAAIMQDEINRDAIEERTREATARRKKDAQEREAAKRILNKIGYQDGYQFKRYIDLPNEPDFAQTVEKAKANEPSWMERAQFWKKTSNPVEDAYRQMEKMWGKEGATQEDIREKTLKRTMGVGSESDNMLRKYALMTDRERYTYDYVFEKAGKEAADKYLDSLQDTINLRSAQDKYTRDETTVPDPMKIPYNIGKSFGIGAESAVKGIGHLPDAILGRQPDYNITESEYYQELLNSQAGGAERLAYNLASGVGNMAPSIAIAAATGGAGSAGAAGTMGKLGGKLSAWAAKGAVGSGVMSAQTAGQTYRQDIMEGRPVEGAQMNAALTAADEYVTNWLLGGIAAYGGGAVGKVLKNSKVGQAAKQGISNALAKNPAIRRAVLGAANYGGDMLSEGTQEAVQDLTESVRKSMIYGDNLDLAGDLKDSQTWEDFALGALTAGILNAPGAISNNRAINQYGKSINPDYRDYVNGLSDIKPESYADPADYQEASKLKQMAEEYAAKQANKEFVSNREKAEYAIRFQQFMENTMRHNEEKVARENAQNSQQATGTEADEQTYTEPETAEYEPYNEPEEAPTKAQNQTEPTQKPAVNQTVASQAVPNQTEAYRKPYGKNGQEALQKGYDGSIELSAYNKAFGRAYDAGYYNVSMDIAERSAIMSVLTNEQFVDAYKAGAQDYNTDNNIDLKTGRPKTVPQGIPRTGGLGTVSESATTPQRKVAEHIGKMTGLKINLVDGLGQTSAAGSYGNGEITISINSNDFNGTLTHELTHHIKKYSPKGYRLYTEIAVEAVMKSENTSLENLMESYENRYAEAGQELTREEIMDEVVADATQKFFNDPKFIDSITKKDKTIAQRIVDFLSDVVDSIKQLMKNGSTRAAAKGLEEDLRYYEDARDAWMHALSDASETYKADKQGQAEGQKEQYALEKPELVTDENIEENYKKVKNMEPVAELSGKEFPRGEKKLSEQVWDFFDSIGGKVHNDIIGEILLDKRAIKDDLAHGITDLKAIAFASVPDVLREGEVLDHQVNWKGRGYDSATVGAKVKIGGEEHYVIAVVKLRDKNRLYLHSVYTTKVGENTVLDQVFPSIDESTSGGHSLPIYSIFNKLMDVNGENQPEKVKLQLEDADIDPNEVKRLQEQNQVLKEANELLQEQFKLTAREDTRQEDIAKIAKSFLDKYQSSYNDRVLRNNLTKLYEYIRSTGQVDRDGLTEAATGIARGILKQARSQYPELADMYKGVRKEIKNTKIKLSDQDRADLGEMGGYESFRKKYFGKITLSKDGISIDSLYQKLSEQHPELFPADITHPADQLMAVAHAIDQTQEYVQNPYHADMDEMSYIVGQEIIQSYFEIQNKIPTFADQKEAQLNQAKADYVAKMKKCQNDFDKKLNQYKAELKERYTKGIREANIDIVNERQILAGQLKRVEERMKNATGDEWKEAKKEYNELMERGRDLNRQKAQVRYVLSPKKYVESMQKVRENKQKSSNKQKIIKDTMTIQNWLLKPDNKKHVPDEVKGIVLEFIKSIDYSSKYLNQKGEPTQRTRAWDELQKFYEAVKDGGEWEGDNKESVYFDCDPDIINRMRELKKRVYDIERLDDLSAREVDSLQKVVSSMKKTIMEMNDLKANRMAEQVEELAGKALGDLGKIAGESGRQEYGGTTGLTDKMLNYDNITPYTFFWRMGSAMESMYSTFRSAADKKTTMLKEADDYIDGVKRELKITRKEILEWSGPRAKRQTFQVKGGSISLTPAQIMSLYEANKRGQARGHIYGDGIRSAPKLAKDTSVKGVFKPSKIIKSYTPVKVSPVDVDNITSTLTPKQKQFADAIQEFLSTRAADWGNEASVLMYGYKKFAARDYFPIITDANYIQSKEGDLKNMQTTIRNLGMTKNTTKNANNAVVMDDILDIFSRHIDQMSTYSSFLAPLSDFNKVYNYKNREKSVSIKQEIERAMGSPAQDYIQTLIHDINGDFRGDSNLFEKFLSNKKASAVAGSISVAIQQPASYLRAMAEIDLKYLGSGAFTMTRKGQWDLICKYAPIAQWKDWGFYQMNTSRSIKDIMFETDSTMNRITNWSMGLAERGDRFAWNRIWRACENEVSDKHKELKRGTDEYYKKVGERFSEIIDRTQVVDSVLHRSQIMRRKDLGLKMATAFMGEPTSTYNMIYRAAVGIQQHREGAIEKATKTAGAIVATLILGAALKSVATAPRDDDKDKSLAEKYGDAFWENLIDSANPIGLVPFGKDIVSIAQGYSVERLDVQGFQDIKYAIDKIMKLAKGDNTLTPQYTAVYASKMLGNLFGTPASNIMREAETALNVYSQYINKGIEDDYVLARQKYEIKNKANLGMYVDMMIEARRNGKKELQKKIKTDLNEAGIDNETISDKIKSTIKAELVSKDYIDPRIETAAQAKMGADTETYKAAVGELIAEGYAGKLVTSVVDSRINQLSTGEEIDWEAETKTDPDELYGEILTGEEDEEEWSIYSSRDILGAIEQVDNTVKSLDAFKAISNEIIDSKTKAGKTKSEAISSIKSSITRSYKEKWIAAYLEGNRKEYEAIQAKLNVLRVDGKNIYSGTDYSSWRKAAKEKEKEENTKK